MARRKKNHQQRTKPDSVAPRYSKRAGATPRTATRPRIDPKVEQKNNRPDLQAREPTANLIDPGERASVVWHLQIALETDEVKAWSASAIADQVGDVTCATVINIRHGRQSDMMSLKARKIAAAVGCDLFVLPQDVPYEVYIQAAKSYESVPAKGKERFNLALRVCRTLATEIKKFGKKKSKTQPRNKKPR